jgi:NADPH:quinone reductase-like Zn-dependent oxidoreductase
MVIAHDPVYPTTHVDDLIPCTDNAGEIEAVGESSIWKVGERVFIHPNRWVEGTAGLDAANLKALGGGDTHGTLRQYAVFVSRNGFSSRNCY